MIGIPYRHLHSAIYRFKDAVQGTGIYRYLAQIKAEQFLPLPALEELQSMRLRKLLLRAAEHSPYYKEIFGKNGIIPQEPYGLAQLPDLPLLRRQDLQANYRSILCDDAQNILANSSGGSTGNPVNFFIDGNYISWARAANLLFMDWMGIRAGDKTAVFWGADKEIKNLSLREQIWIKFDRVRLLNSFSMTEKAIADFIGKINDFKPRYIHGYAGSLYFIARIINASRPLEFTPAAIRSSAEMLYDFQREEIERAFKARIFNFYGSREVNNLAAECPAHEGLHIFSSGRIVEIVDDCGRPVPDGVVGQIAVTDLTNLSFPFIRYLNGDLAVKRVQPCTCGRGYPLLEKIEGRTTDMIMVNNQIIHGEYFTHLFYSRPEVRQFQVIQEDAGTIRILVSFRNGAGNIDDLVAKIKNKIGPDINISVEQVDQIPLTGTGKYRFTISKLAGTPVGG